MGVWWYFIVVIICISQISKDIEYVFYEFAISVSSFENIYSNILPIYKLVAFIILSCKIIYSLYK